MKRAFLSIATLAIFTAGVAGISATTSAQDSGATAATEPAHSGPTKFYGTISAVDTNANTFTIDDQVYNITAESKMTKASDGSTATIADATVGEPARGTYTKSADGKLEVTKVRFGKKSGGGKKKHASTDQSSSS